MMNDISNLDRLAAQNVMQLVVDTMRNLQSNENENPQGRGLLGDLTTWGNERPDTELNTRVYQSLDSMAAILCATIDVNPTRVLTGFLRASSSCKNDFKNWTILRDMTYEKIVALEGEEKARRKMVGMITISQK